MSKSDGPAASSFESPRKVGWLYKQGGSGVTSHWRKRWFVADHHYLFYYKKPDDKSPVGILCLPEYDSCRKSEGKEWKKPNTFLLDKGKESGDSADGPSKSYVLHSDSEDEMLEWIKALKEEMKPMLGDTGKDLLPNGRGQPLGMKTKGKSKSEADVKVDPKAFNELSVLASETPKLTHLTASRPKVRNRRPPKKYAVFHEDDSKEDESPPPSPAAKPLPTPPTVSPSAQPKKGHRPSAPIIPNKPKPLTPPKEKRDEVSPSPVHEAGEQGTSPPETKKAPPPPKKPSKDRPLPPSKPSKTSIEPSEPVEPEAMPPTKKPRPQPPVKPRSSVPTPPPTDKPTPPQPVPRPKPRRRTHVTPDTPTAEEAPPPILSEETIPPITEETSPIIEDDVTTAQEVTPEEKEPIPDETTPTIPEETTPTEAEADTSPAPVDTPPASAEELAPSKEMSEPLAEIADTQASTEEETKEETKEEAEKPKEPSVSKEEAIDGSKGSGGETVPTSESPPVENGGSKDEEEVKNGASIELESKTEEVENKEKNNDSESDEDTYEDMTMGAGPLGEEKSDSGSEYEEIDFPPDIKAPPMRHDYDSVPSDGFTDSSVEISVSQTNSMVPQPVDTSSRGQSTSSYVMMDPTSPAGDGYVEVNGGVFKEDTHDYDQPREWGSKVNESPGKTKPGEYDILPPARPASTQSANSLDRGSPGVITSSGSTGSRGHGSPVMPRKGSKGQSDRLSALRAEEGADKSVERDRSPSAGSQGYSKPRTPSMDSTHSVSGTLRQAKEILRLAHMVKAEADEMKEEARRELELARREKHDAELLKKNAAQILKMAKERLSDSKPR